MRLVRQIWKGRGSGWDEPTVTTAFTRNVYFRKMSGLGGASMFGLMRNPVWGGWL